MTVAQIKLLKTLLIVTFGVSFYQALIIQRFARKLKYGANQFNKLHEAADYLLEVIDKNNIELTEFDLIALSAITENK